MNRSFKEIRDDEDFEILVMVGDVDGLDLKDEFNLFGDASETVALFQDGSCVRRRRLWLEHQESGLAGPLGWLYKVGDDWMYVYHDGAMFTIKGLLKVKIGSAMHISALLSVSDRYREFGELAVCLADIIQKGISDCRKEGNEDEQAG